MVDPVDVGDCHPVNTQKEESGQDMPPFLKRPAYNILFPRIEMDGGIAAADGRNGEETVCPRSTDSLLTGRDLLWLAA